jgi:hypothetical protein
MKPWIEIAIAQTGTMIIYICIYKYIGFEWLVIISLSDIVSRVGYLNRKRK